MDRPEPSPAMPASTQGTSSTAQNTTTGITQASALPSGGTLGASSTQGPPLETPELRVSEPVFESSSQQQPHAPILQTENAPEQLSRVSEPEPQRQMSGQLRPQTAPGPSTEFSSYQGMPMPMPTPEGTSVQRPRTASTPPQSTSGSQRGIGTYQTPVPTTGMSDLPQLPPPRTGSPSRLPEPTNGVGFRPTTGSTLGGPGTDPQLLGNPPTPTRPYLPQLSMGRPVSAGISVERFEDGEGFSGPGHHGLQRDGTTRSNQPFPPTTSQTRFGDGIPRRQRTQDGHGSVAGHGVRQRSGLDWIVPTSAVSGGAPAPVFFPTNRPLPTVASRLQPTVDHATREVEKYRLKAKRLGWALNGAIGLQVILGSLTTGLSAVATTGRQTSVQTTVLGALTTLVASYLAQARGSDELERAHVNIKKLKRFVRETTGFILDHGYVDTTLNRSYDDEIEQYRKQFEDILGSAEKSSKDKKLKKERKEKEKEKEDKEKEQKEKEQKEKEQKEKEPKQRETAVV